MMSERAERRQKLAEELGMALKKRRTNYNLSLRTVAKHIGITSTGLWRMEEGLDRGLAAHNGLEPSLRYHTIIDLLPALAAYQCQQRTCQACGQHIPWKGKREVHA